MSHFSDFPRFSKPNAITSCPKEHFFAAYYAIDPWSADGRFATVLETEVVDRLPDENDVAVLGVVDSQTNNSFIPLTDTRCWNFQESTMAHWLPAKETKQSFIFNDLEDGTFVSVIYDMQSGTRSIIPWPISAVAPNGKWALSINYARLRLTRAEYGYGGNGQDPLTEAVWPENDGLWKLDLESKKAELIISIASLRDKMFRLADESKALSYICHTKFSRDGSKILFLARTVENYTLDGHKKRHTTAFTCNSDGNNVQRCFPDGWGGSHFNWLNGEQLMLTCNFKNTLYTHVLFTAGKQDYRRLGNGILDFDGHCVFSDDGRWLATDTYENPLHERCLYVVRTEDEAILPIGSFYVPPQYRGLFWRCDLHPRWSSDGKRLAFNATHEGTRQAYVIDLSY